MKKSVLVIALVATLVLGGCTTTNSRPYLQTETVYLQTEDGLVAQCGPYIYTSADARRDLHRWKAVADDLADGTAATVNYDHRLRQAMEKMLRQCVNDYLVSGYRRIPAPPN